jgi:hypothetical protein
MQLEPGGPRLERFPVFDPGFFNRGRPEGEPLPISPLERLAADFHVPIDTVFREISTDKSLAPRKSGTRNQIDGFGARNRYPVWAPATIWRGISRTIRNT